MASIIRELHTAENDIEFLSGLDYYNHLLNFRKLKSEIKSWNKCLKTITDSHGKNYDIDKVGECLRLFAENKLPREFPELLKVFKIYMCIGVTSASAERSFSAFIKTNKKRGVASKYNESR